MATLIKPVGPNQMVQPKNGSDFSLEELQEYAGGYVQVVNLADGRLMVIDEEGKFKYGRALNPEASKLLLEAGGAPGDYINGNALICFPAEVK